jgi:thioredoxin 1
MNQWIRRYFDKFALVAVAIVIAGLAFCSIGNTCPIVEGLNGQSDTDTQKTGDRAMLTATRQDGKVHHANDANFDELVLASDVPVLVDFYADWCGPCRMIAPALEELAKETTDARIVKVNVDHSPRLAARYGINSIPSLKVFDEGKVVDEHVGLANKGRLKKMLDI